MWALLEQGRTLMHCRYTTFIYHNDSSKHINVEQVTSEDAFDYLFDLGVGKLLLEKEKKYLHDLFEKWDP